MGRATAEIIEGTWEEISQQSVKFNGHRLRVIILPVAEPVSPSLTDAENAAVIAYLQKRLELALINPKEIKQSGEELAELHRNLDRNRSESGERSLFPE